MAVRVVVVRTPSDEVELASDRLWQLGVRGIEERATELDGVVELRAVVGGDPAALQRAGGVLAGQWEWYVDDVEEGWSQRWREHARPLQIGEGLLIVPAWLSPPADTGGRIAVSVEPGSAFGLGDHPTTALTLAALERIVAARAPASLLDVGCGTGVLAIAGALLGVAAVRAIDVASVAVEATVDNARRNGVSAVVGVDDTPLALIDDRFDLVVANVLAPALVSMADDLRRCTAAEGRLVVSGILELSHRHVLAALAPMEVERSDAADGWAAVTLRHSSR